MSVLVVRSIREPVIAAPGRIHAVQVCGRQRDDGLWEGWLEFQPTDGSPALRTSRETTQPNLTDLQYWAGGLTAVYLEGALRRALAAEDRGDADAGAAAVLDPFSVSAKGEEYLRGRLDALSARHLRSVIRFYGLADDRAIDLDALTEAELAGLIVTGVRRRRAA